MRKRLSTLATLLGCALLVLAPASAATRSPTLTFRVFARTRGHKIDSIVWTGRRFLYVENTTNRVWSSPPAGTPLELFATMPNLVEESRCIESAGAHGFPAGVIFCHSPDDKIYEISEDGSNVSVFATLPAPAGTVSDGALDFDRVGKFGFQLVAATGRSGASMPAGGVVYTISPAGHVTQVGTYAGPGGADELMVAPASFGTVGGDALLTVDAGAGGGSLVAVDPGGGTRTIFQTEDGLNPIASIVPETGQAKRSPAAGLYLTNDIASYVYFAPAQQLSGYADDIIVGSEDNAQMWILVPSGSTFTALQVTHNLRGPKHSLEQAIFVP